MCSLPNMNKYILLDGKIVKEGRVPILRTFGSLLWMIHNLVIKCDNKGDHGRFRADCWNE